MKCETPARSSFSSREPAPIQKPIETERTLGTFSEMTRSPESSSDMTYFCTSPSLGHELEAAAVPLRLVQGVVGEAEERLRVLRMAGARGDAEARLQPVEPIDDSLDDLAAVVLARLCDEQRELVAADPEGIVTL